MSEFHEAQQRDLILFVGGQRDEAGAVVLPTKKLRQAG